LGILVKNSESLELAGSVTTVVLDKTGTVTQGLPQVTDLVRLDQTLSEEELLTIASSAESGSEHPLGEAIQAAARQRGLSPLPLTKFRSIAGRGVSAQVDGHQVMIGSLGFLQKQNIALDDTAQQAVRQLESQAKTVVLATVDGHPAGIFGIMDTLKENSQQAVQQLRALGLNTVMLTGDNEATARAIASQAGIEQVYASLLPADKIRQIEKLQAEGQRVLMVGDGINDAPALMQADVGMAIGTGTDVAIASAPIVSISGDLMAAPLTVRLSGKTLRTIKQNLFWAFFYNVLLIPAAALGMLNPMLAAGAMSFSSIFVVTNSLRLKRFK
jgi:Cu+-exporting ATPase